MVTNQDGLGTERFPRAAFEACQEFVLEAFRPRAWYLMRSSSVPTWSSEGCACRKPKTGLLDEYLRGTRSILRAVPSSVIVGAIWHWPPTSAIRGLTVCRNGAPDQTWSSVVEALTARHASRGPSDEGDPNRRARESRSRAIHLRSSPGLAFSITCSSSSPNTVASPSSSPPTVICSVDEHHTVEDSALALGTALRQALRDKLGIGRYGFVLPMDEAQAAGRAGPVRSTVLRVRRPISPRQTMGALPTELVPHFFRSLSETLKATLHLSVKGENTHHMVEACFKGVGRALRQAVTCEGRALPSTKGVL